MAGDGEAYPLAGCGAATCPPLWVADGAATTGPSHDETPVVAEDHTMFSLTGRGVTAIDADGRGAPTCQPLWTDQLGGAADWISVADSRVHVSLWNTDAPGSPPQVLTYALDA